jgi:hypothetical protein
MFYILFIFNSFALDDVEESYFLNIENVINQKIESDTKKKGLLGEVREARKLYREIKDEDPGLREKVRALRDLNRLIKGNTDLKNIDKGCEDSEHCLTRIENIIDQITSDQQAKSKLVCDESEKRLQSSYEYSALIYGEHKACGIKYIGPGIFAGSSAHMLICTHPRKRGVNVGFGIKFGAILNIGSSLVFGANGACLSISGGIGIGAFAGAILVNSSNNAWN